MSERAPKPRMGCSMRFQPQVRRFHSFPSLGPLLAVCLLSFLTAGSVAVAQSPQKPATTAAGQQATATGQTLFSSAVNEVIVPITATDSKGRFISDLVQSDFHLFDEGKEQKIDIFSHQQSQPVVIGFLIDMSNRMKVNWERYKDSTSELMINLLPGDKKYSGYLITYGNQPELVTDTSSDPEAMVAKVAKMKPAGGSALFDAIYMACTSRKAVQG